jgi:hypothetical protein
VSGTPFYRFYLLTHDHLVAIRREADCDGVVRVITTAARIAEEWQIRPTKSETRLGYQAVARGTAPSKPPAAPTSRGLRSDVLIRSQLHVATSERLLCPSAEPHHTGVAGESVEGVLKWQTGTTSPYDLPPSFESRLTHIAVPPKPPA